MQINSKIVDTSNTISKDGRCQKYWQYRILNPLYAEKKKADDRNDIDIMDILKKYYIKGFEFGNWLSNKERYDSLTAFLDAAEVVNKITGIKNIGLDGLIGVAFGARGKGRALAHYEPWDNMINLTKLKGYESFAHEWGHAIDYNIGKFVDQNKHYSYLSGGWSTGKFLPDNIGYQARHWVNAIVDEIKLTESYKRISIEGDYWCRRTEVFARFWEQYICYLCRINKQSTNFLCKDWTTYCSKPQYLTQEDWNKVLPTAIACGRALFKIIGSKKTTLNVMPYHYATLATQKTADPKNKKAAANKNSNAIQKLARKK